MSDCRKPDLPLAVKHRIDHYIVNKRDLRLTPNELRWVLREVNSCDALRHEVARLEGELRLQDRYGCDLLQHNALMTEALLKIVRLTKNDDDLQYLSTTALDAVLPATAAPPAEEKKAT